MRRVLLVLVGVLALLPSAYAADLELQGRPQLRTQIDVAEKSGVVEFTTDFHVEVTGQGYLKVLPSTGNPTFLNGTPVSGWWTIASVEQEGEIIGEGGTNGTTVAQLGSFEAGRNYTLHLQISVPAVALTEPTEYRLAYALAVKRADTGTGSGGSLDPSVSVLPRIEIVEAEASAQENDVGSPIQWDPQWGLPFALLATLGLALVVRTVARRRRGGPEDAPSGGDRRE